MQSQQIAVTHENKISNKPNNYLLFPKSPIKREKEICISIIPAEQTLNCSNGQHGRNTFTIKHF